MSGLASNYLARNVLNARNIWRWSQWRMAKTIGVDQASISFWERGIVTPAGSALTALACLLGCSVMDLTTTELKIPDQPVDLPCFKEPRK